MGAIDDLQALAEPLGLDVAVNGETLSVEPMRVRDIAPFARAAAPFWVEVQQRLLGEGLTAADILALAGEHGEAFTAAVAVAVRRDPAWVADLLPDDLVRLVGAAVEVNANFFVRRLLPTITATATQLAPVVGGMPQPGSAPTATPTG